MNSKTDYSWDRSHYLDINKDIKYYPKNIKELNLIIKTKINKDSFVIKTGGASYFDKSFGPGKHTISLKNFDTACRSPETASLCIASEACKITG